MSHINLPIIITDIVIRQDEQGRFCLNDLHKASGGEKRHSPNYWLTNQQTQELIEELSKPLIIPNTVITVTDRINDLAPVNIIQGFKDNKGFGFAQCTNGIYKPLFGATASKLKAQKRFSQKRFSP